MSRVQFSTMGIQMRLGCLAVLIFLIDTPAAATSTTSSSIAFPPPSNCRTRCGNVSIEYPFGIGQGCFLPGFNLTCDESSKPPKLYLGNNFLEVKYINTTEGSVLFGNPVTVMSKDQDSYNGTVIEIPKNGPYTLSLGKGFNTSYPSVTSNYIRVIGCNAYVSLMDTNTGNMIEDCVTFCSFTQLISCAANIGCCTFSTGAYRDYKSYSIKLDRAFRNETSLNRTNILAFVTHNSSMEINYDDLTTHNFSKEEAKLWWYMDGQGYCEEAMKNDITSYACKSANSVCQDAYPNGLSHIFEEVGYFCQCPVNRQGNPYLTNGCLDSSFTTLPTNTCSTKCGDMNIPFPFGLDIGCYRDANFAVSCDTSSSIPIPIINNFDTIFQVTNISLQEGQVWVTPFNFFKTVYPFWPFRLSMEQVEILDWVIDYQSCKDAKQNMSTYACKSSNSSCVESTISIVKEFGYRCKCETGYDGNPYLPGGGGCQDINECADHARYPCNGICTNYIGNYSCSCPPGTSGDPIFGYCLPNKNNNRGVILGVVIGVSTGSGLLLLAIGVFFLLRRLKEQRQKLLRERFFKQNHGLLLEQLISSTETIDRRTRIFTLEELEKATNNFDDTRILGRGGHGTVYKGILSDQRVVAIKKSKIVVKSEIDQFINEVAILTQINHRNIVSLFGCCLETEVPLLVYEFVSNGTLSDHLHKIGHNSTFTWQDRLRIATEASGALAYLHSAASISIFHRDVKSSNILLDDYYTAKVSDFGASRSIPLDQTRVLTDVQGTFGYLDPEYFQSGELTEKSDVYSFGVILVELLTGHKPTSLLRNDEEKSVLMYFLQAVKDHSIFHFIDGQIVEQGTREVIQEVIQIAEECLKLQGKERPTMREVEFYLKRLSKKEKEKLEKLASRDSEEAKHLLSDFYERSESQSVIPFHPNHSISISQDSTRQYITAQIEHLR